MTAHRPVSFASLPIRTRSGVFTAVYSSHGLMRLEFPSPAAKSAAGRVSIPPAVRGWHRLSAQALRRVLSGKIPDGLPPLDLSGGTVFQKTVWECLRKIPFGTTVTYVQLAALAGHPRSARAVGGACGANPIPVLVPCHRVTSAGRSLGGFSGGLRWKKRLLALEQQHGGIRQDAAAPR